MGHAVLLCKLPQAVSSLDDLQHMYHFVEVSEQRVRSGFGALPAGLHPETLVRLCWKSLPRGMLLLWTLRRWRTLKCSARLAS